MTYIFFGVMENNDFCEGIEKKIVSEHLDSLIYLYICEVVIIRKGTETCESENVRR